MKRISLILLILSLHSSVFAQDKDAEAKVHYIRAEEYFNTGTYYGAEMCIEELENAEKSLGTTNSKILYLKIIAAHKLDLSSYYWYDKIMWLKNFFMITDSKTFPFEKYAEILKINDKFFHLFVKDVDFEKKVKDSSYIANSPELSPNFKFSAEAQFKLGDVIISDRKNTTKSDDSNALYDECYERANMYFRSSANSGNTEAMIALGNAYSSGLGVSKDYPKALTWYKKAQENGNARAKTYIDILYKYHVAELTPDAKDAIQTYEKQAEDGNIDAMSSIGNVYFFGKKVDKDYVKAAKWFTKFVEKSNNVEEKRHVFFHLYMIYNDGGFGLEKDSKKAIEWHNRWEESKKKN